MKNEFLKNTTNQNNINQNAALSLSASIPIISLGSEPLRYVEQTAMILIPVLSLVGFYLKNNKLVPDKFIPLILLVLGVLASLLLLGPSANSVFQGILITGAAVYGDQLAKQMNKKDE